MLLFRKKTHIADSKKYLAEKKTKHIRNVQRLRYYLESGNLKGIGLITKYLESEGVRIPRNVHDCDRLIQELSDVA